MNSPKALYKFLSGKKGDVADLITRAKQLESLSKKLGLIMDKPLSAHCQLANIHEKSLVLTVDSPVWASRLRYAAPTLLRKLKNNFPQIQGIEKIEISIQPLRRKTRKPSPAERKISPAAANCILAMADNITDPALKSALQRLASHTNCK